MTFFSPLLPTSPKTNLLDWIEQVNAIFSLKYSVSQKLKEAIQELTNTLTRDEQTAAFRKHLPSRVFSYPRDQQPPLTLLFMDQGPYGMDKSSRLFVKCPQINRSTKPPASIIELRYSLPHQSNTFAISSLKPDHEYQVLVWVHNILKTRNLPSIKPYSKKVDFDQGVYSIFERFCEKGTMNDTFPQKMIISMFGMVLQQLAALHDSGFVHRDIKPENIFITGDDKAILGDFGESYVDGVTPQPTDYKGAFAYAPKEVFHGYYLEPASDVWSFCISLLETIIGKRNIDNSLNLASSEWERKMECYSIDDLQIIWNEFLDVLPQQFPSPDDPKIILSLQSFLKQTLIVDMDKRPSMSECLILYYRIFFNVDIPSEEAVHPDKA